MSEQCTECGRTLPRNRLRVSGCDSDGDIEVTLYICDDCVEEAEQSNLMSDIMLEEERQLRERSLE